MKSYLKVVSVLIIAVFMVGVYGVSAGPFGGKGMGRCRGGWSSMGLTDVQKDELAEIVEPFRADIETSVNALGDAAAALSAAVRSEVYDPAAVEAAFDAASAEKLKLAQIKARVYAAFYPSLTDEQKALMEERAKARAERMEERMEKRLSRLDDFLGLSEE